MDSSVIIPSAKLVPEELQKLGKLPAIIYPINQKIVFDYLYEQYKEYCNDIRIICYEEANKVNRRLAKYASEKLHIVTLDVLGELSDTIYEAIKDINNPIIINFADTIMMDEIDRPEEDAFFYTEDYISDTWTFFREDSGKLTDVYDKVSIQSNEREKLFVGVFKIKHTEYFIECIEEAKENPIESISIFYLALRSYSQQHPMKPIKTENWFDIGHADTYYSSKLSVKAREFNHITIDRDRSILKKSSDDKEKLIGEIKWYLKLPTDVEYVRPRLFVYSTEYTNPYVSMEYYAYHTIHEMFLYGDLNKHQWVDIFNRIRFVCRDFKRYTVSDMNIKNALEDMYLTKTLQRLKQLKRNIDFKYFFTEKIVVNGICYKSIEKIEKLLANAIPALLYDVESFNIIHGDLCFTNIMIDRNFSFIKLIDPRGKFGTYDIYGDFRYELAKLFHSIDGKYDFIIKDLFTLNYDIDTATIKFSVVDRKWDFDLCAVFTEVFADEIGDNIKKIELIEALLLLSMIPLHRESIEHQMVMLGTGLEILNRVVDIRE